MFQNFGRNSIVYLKEMSTSKTYEETNLIIKKKNNSNRPQNIYFNLEKH